MDPAPGIPAGGALTNLPGPRPRGPPNPLLKLPLSIFPLTPLQLWRMSLKLPTRALFLLPLYPLRQTTYGHEDEGRDHPFMVYVPFSTSNLYNWKNQNAPFSKKPHELLDPEELPLPGLGTSFSTLSHSSLGSILLLEKRREQLRNCPKMQCQIINTGSLCLYLPHVNVSNGC